MMDEKEAAWLVKRLRAALSGEQAPPAEAP
jgi:hypothetical protein